MAQTHQPAKTQYASNGDIRYAYRRFGKEEDVPLLLLIHFRGTMDYWDPILVNALASLRPVILFDNAGVGQSGGSVATTIKGMAQHVIDFLSLIKVKELDLLGFSMGGHVAQMVTLNAPSGLIRKLVLAGTGPSAGEEVVQHPTDQQQEVGKLASQPECTYENCFYRLFFYPSDTALAAGQEWWKRAHERNRDTSGEERSKFVSTNHEDGGAGLQNMGEAGNAFSNLAKRADGSYDRLSEITVPVFIGQGHDDFMIPTVNSYIMQQNIPNARLKVFPDSGHAFLCQYAVEFADDVAKFLDAH